jgi:hypothetical protein
MLCQQGRRPKLGDSDSSGNDFAWLSLLRASANSKRASPLRVKQILSC